MNANIVTALAALLGSVAGASAAIATTWISQKGQTLNNSSYEEQKNQDSLKFGR